MVMIVSGSFSGGEDGERSSFTERWTEAPSGSTTGMGAGKDASEGNILIQVDHH